LGKSIFVTNWAIIGLLLTAILVAWMAFIVIQMVRFKGKLFKHVENAKRLFNNPTDQEAEIKFRNECHKSIIPYLYSSHLIQFGIGNLFTVKSISRKIITTTIQLLITLYISYSLFVLLIKNSTLLSQISVTIFPHIPYYYEIQPIFLFAIQNLVATTILLFLISLYFYSNLIRQVSLSIGNAAQGLIVDPLSLLSRAVGVGSILLPLPWIISNMQNSSNIVPFTLSSNNLVETIQKAVQNITQKDCNVIKFSYEIENEKDIDSLKYIISKENNVPSLIKIVCLNADPKKALKRICEAQPLLYLGLIDNRCAIMCSIEYDAKRKVYKAFLTFDSVYLKTEFQSIVKNVISEQKTLKRDLPKDIEELIKKLKVHDNDRFQC
jgi:hypothetical protein